jgi:CDP-glucose 4,6-dehydratase
MTKQEVLNFYKGKKVLVTGHTGFKGSWLVKILTMAGAEVTGYSLEPPTDPSLFELADLSGTINHVVGDIRDYEKLNQVFNEVRPEIVLHLAAQPIVRTSYDQPRYTYETNVMGTVNICECVRTHMADPAHPEKGGVSSFLNVTTDKVYKNNEWHWGYRENEPLDGFDPYSNSKSCSELVTHSYINSFFGGNGAGAPIAVSTARAGNVIGGGDFAADRIIPDCVRAVEADKPIIIRNPNSTRPYQHVLEPLFTYLTVAAEQSMNHEKAGFYNVGPDDCDCVTTGELVELFEKHYNAAGTTCACDCSTGNDKKDACDIASNLEKKTAASSMPKFRSEINHDPNAPHEANFLKLDTSLIKSTFGWKPTWHIDEAIEKTVEWSRVYLDNGDSKAINDIMQKQIEEFIEK